jgi:hypothetical protein
MVLVLFFHFFTISFYFVLIKPLRIKEIHFCSNKTKYKRNECVCVWSKQNKNVKHTNTHTHVNPHAISKSMHEIEMLLN